MAISFVGVSTLTSGPSTTFTLDNIPLPSGIQAGDLIILSIGAHLEHTVLTPPSGYTLLDNPQDAGSLPAMANLFVYYKIATGSDTSPSVEFVDRQFITAIASVYRGVDNSTPFIDHVWAPHTTAGANPKVAGTMTSANVDKWAVFIGHNRQLASPATWTPPTGFTERADIDPGVTSTTNPSTMLADSNGAVTNTGAITYEGYTDGSTAIAVAWAAFLLPATGGGGGTITKTASESRSISISETTSRFVTKSASDTSAVSVSDTGSRFSSFAASESRSLSIAETAAVNVVATKTASDSTVYTLAESRVLTGVNNIVATDSTIFGVAEVASQTTAATKTASDTQGLRITDTSTLTTVAAKARPRPRVQDKPDGLWWLDDTLPFQDYSGFNRLGTSTGTPGTAMPTVANAEYATIFHSTAVGEFTTNVFNQGRERSGFTLEGWVYPIAKTTAADQQILGHTGQYDGILVNGTTVRFVTKYLTQPAAVVEYDTQVRQAMHIVATHTADKNALYINGYLVASMGLTEEQQADTFIASNGKLYVGQSTSTQQIAANGLAVYSRALTPTDVLTHFLNGTTVVPGNAVAPLRGGEVIPLSKEQGDTFSQVWTTEYDWGRGFGTNVVYENALIPEEQEGLSLAGTWLGIFPLDALVTTSIYGVSMNWDGLGATVQASLDGIAWTPVVKNTNISIIPAGFDPTDKVLHIQVIFPGGLPDDQSYIQNLVVTATMGGGIAQTVNRAVTLTGATMMLNHEPVLLREDWGTSIHGGSITIGPDTSTTPINPRTIEVWVKQRSGTAFNINVAGTKYVNGVAGSTLDSGEWSLHTIVAAAPVTGNIVISGDVIIGQVAVYESALSAKDILDIFQEYNGVPVVKINTETNINISMGDPASKIYSYDWSITGAG